MLINAWAQRPVRRRPAPEKRSAEALGYVEWLAFLAKLHMTNVISATWIMLFTKDISSSRTPHAPTADENIVSETNAVNTKFISVKKYRKKSKSKYPFLT
ncbi:MAG TPA: hypothetical protein DEO68_13170 [Halomonas campaniensis]|uniref:Uncharacterized protein n=1 Tax=Halomonas campaniensis TaxID=213554 RepID=A0A3D0KHZ0_9GAMM|nr:hypothetical protein [Halomonas campaniensis]